MADNNTPRTFTDADFADDPSTLKPVKASAARKLGDLALGFGQGAVGATKALSDAFGANNAVSQGLEGVNQFLDAGISGETKDRRFEADRIQQEAKGKGIAAEVAGFGKAFATDPIQQTVQGLGSVAPFVAAQFVPGVGQSATAARLAQVGMGLGMGAGTAKGAIHEEVQKRELAAGKTAEQAQAAADAAQAYGGENSDQIALGAGLGLADAVTGATPAAVRLLRQKLGKEVLEEGSKKASEGIFKAGAKGALAEMPVEFAQGGQEQLAANIAAQRAGYQADTWEGVVGKGGMEALASAGPGAAFGIAGRNRGADPQPQPDPNAPQAEGQPPIGPQGGVSFDSNATPALDARALEAAGVSMPPPAAVLDSGRIDRMVDLGTEQQPINASEQQGGPKNSDEDGYLGSSIAPISIGGQEAFIAQHPENVMRQMQGLEQNPRLNKIAASRQDAEHLIGDMWLGYGNKDNDKLVQDFLSNVNGSTYAEPLSEVPASKRMGLDASVGPLSAAAVTAVDSGASPAAAALASGVGGGFGIGRAARGEPVDVTPINQSAGQIGATKRLGETPIIDVEARWKDEGPRQGDMMAPNNAPFQSQALALQASQQTPQGGEVVAVPNGFVVRPQLLGIEQPTQAPRLGYDGERKGAATRLAERQPTAQAPQQPPEKYQSEPVRAPENRQNTVKPSAEPPRLGMTPAQQRDFVENPEYMDLEVLRNGEQSNAAKNTASKLPRGQFARLAINKKNSPYENSSKTTTHGAWVSDGNGGAKWVEEPTFESRKTPPSEKRIGELFGEAVKQESEKEQKKIQQVNARKEQFKNMGVAIGSELKGAQAYVAGKKGITTYSSAKVDSFDENGMAIIRATLRGSKHEYKLVVGPESSIFDGLRKTAPESRQQPPVRDGSTPIAMGMETYAGKDIPKAVKDKLKFAVSRLNSVKFTLDSVKKARGDGHHLATEVARQKDTYDKYASIIADFKQKAEKIGVNLSPFLAEIGDVSESVGAYFNKNIASTDGNKSVTPQKDVVNQAAGAFAQALAGGKSRDDAAKAAADVVISNTGGGGAAFASTKEAGKAVTAAVKQGLAQDTQRIATAPLPDGGMSDDALAQALGIDDGGNMGGASQKTVAPEDLYKAAGAVLGTPKPQGSERAPDAKAATTEATAQSKDVAPVFLEPLPVEHYRLFYAQKFNEPPPVAHYRLKEYKSGYGKWSYVLPGVGKSYSDKDKKDLVSWFKSAGWESEIKEGRVLVRPKEGDSLDDIPMSPSEKAIFEKKREEYLKSQEIAAKKEAEIAALKNTVEYSFVNGLLGDNANSATKIALAKYLTGEKFEGIGGNWVFHLKDAGIDVGDGVQVAHALKGLSAAYKKQSSSTAEAAPAPVNARPANWRTNMISAAKVAKGVGISAKGKKLKDVVAEIDAADVAKAQPEKPVVAGVRQGAVPDEAPWSDAEEKRLMSLIGHNGSISYKEMDGNVVAKLIETDKDNKYASATGKTKLSAKRALLKKLSESKNPPQETEAGAPSSTQADNIAPLLNKLASGYGYSGGIDTMPAGLGKTARKLYEAMLSADVSAVQEILHLENKRSRKAFESLFDGRVKLPKTVSGTNAIVADVLGKIAQGKEKASGTPPRAATDELISGLKENPNIKITDAEAIAEREAANFDSADAAKAKTQDEGQHDDTMDDPEMAAYERGLTATTRAADKQKVADAWNDKPAAKPAVSASPAAQSSSDDILDAELSDALGKLGDVLGDVFGAKLNATGQQYTAGDLLPALSKVVELLAKKGLKSFAQSTGKAAQLMRADPRTAAHVDSISPRQWKAAYNAIAEGFEGTDSEDTINAMKADEVLAIVAPQTAQKPKATTPTKTLAESLYQSIRTNGMPKDNPALKKLVESFDGKPADQARMKQAQEELETAIVMTARDLVAKNDGDRSTFDMLLRLYESQPNLNIRTSTSVANQAYSTPAPLAFLASRLAGVTKATSVHEPTAGTGMLLIGADPKNAIVNELNDLRIDALKLQGFNPTQKDAATQLLVTNGVQPDAVVTNPPFGSIKDADGKPVKVKVDGYSIGQIDHLIAARALDTMKENGRATLIIGANKVAGGLNTDDRIFFNWLYSHYNVVGHFEVEGDLYSRQGAGWPVRVIAINGRQKSNNFSPIAGTIQRVDNWSDVYEQFTRIVESEKHQEAISTKADGGRKRPFGPAESPAATDRKRPAGGNGGSGGVVGALAGDVSNRTEPVATGVGGSGDEQRLNAQSFVPRPQYGQNPIEARKPTQPIGTAALSDTAEQGNEFQTPYTPRSARKDDGVLIPANMGQPIQDALSRLEDAVGDIDEFARKELGYATVDDLHGALMGLQVDSVAMSIYQIKQGKAAVIADQTGIGKGRQAASIIRWAARSGYTPIFVSVKPSLFTDMYGDLADIGTTDITPLIMNGDAWVAGEGGEKLFANKPGAHKRTIQGIADTGELPDGCNAIFLTYSQINVANVQRQALMALAPNAVFVLDESHQAAGASSTGEFVIGVLEEAKGVVYLSATYAKRPDNMPLYFKTDIGLAAADTEGLAAAMAAGGLPLQTVVSNNLVKAGQMFRRERSYDGVSIASVFDSANRSLHERMSNATTKALRAIVDADAAFHRIYVNQLAKQLAESGATVIDSAGNQIQKTVQHTEFSSVVHNFVKQMLLGLKAQSAADEAIASLKRGEKPIIAVENTMGSFLREYAEANSIGNGDSLGSFDYRTVLSRALDRSRAVVEVAANGDKIKRPVRLDELDFLTRSHYRNAQEVIDSINLSIPVSPIDWMRAEIERAGYTVAEITGRDLSVDYSDPNNPILSAIDATEKKDKVNTTRQFNSGKLDALILNVAGSTGISLHASEKFEDQRQRHMIVAQAAGDINTFMQMLGRIHRTGQVRLPKYTILSVDLPTEKRPTAVLSTKMKSLNANTSSNTESATSVKTVDILNKYGDQIVAQYLRDNIQLAKALGMKEDAEMEEGAVEDIARKATGRLALQPIDTQHAFYDEVEAQYNALIEYLNKTNQNDLEPRTFDFDAKEIRQEVLFDGPNKETPFGEDAIYGEYSIKAQGTPMKPVEIRAAMSENLNGATPEAHTQKLMDDLEAKFVTFYSTLEDAGKVGASSVRAATRAFLLGHKIGSKFRIEINGEAFNAVVLNVRNTHKDTGNPYSLSKLQVSVAVNGALRSLSVPATQFSKIEVSSIPPVLPIDALFKEQPPNQRETAKIITGNITAAYGELEGVRGTIVNFTKQDGTIEQGILLPKLFDYRKNTRGDYRLPDGAAALKFLQKSKDKDIGRFGIMTRDGVVRVLPSGQGIRVQVPKTKLRGGKYFLDKALIEVAGDFVTSGNFMVATVYEPADAAKMLDLLMKKQALYALPSMAEEAKQISSAATDNAVKFSRTSAPFGGKESGSTPIGNATEIEVDGVMRPTLNSKGQVIHPTQEGVRNFWRWFGDSQQTDSDNQPIVYHHYGNRRIEKLGGGNFGGGLFVLENQNYASGYGSIHTEIYLAGEIAGSRDLENYLDDLPDGGAEFFSQFLRHGVDSNLDEDQVEAFRDVVIGEGGFDEDGVFEQLTGETELSDAFIMMQEIRGKLAKVAGFSAVHMEDEFSGKAIMVVAPDKIKSATGNQGTFDPNDADIRKSSSESLTQSKAIPRTPAANIRKALEKAYGKLFARLESKGLVTLAQTEQEAIEAAAKARAEKLGTDYQQELDGLMAAVSASRVWHGTAQKGIKQFSTRFLLKGEGANFFGAGLYFTESEDIAEWYRQELSADPSKVFTANEMMPVTIDGKQVSDGDAANAIKRLALLVSKPESKRLTDEYALAYFSYAASQSADAEINQKGTFRAYFIEDRQGEAWAAPIKHSPSEAEWDFLESWLKKNEKRFGYRKADGQVYEVEIPEDEAMLLWDKPIGEQSAFVFKALRKSGFSFKFSDTGKDFYENAVISLSGAEGRLHGPSQAAVSLALRKQGIKGIKYPAGTVTKKGGIGLSNYVIFDGADTKIVDVKYSSSGLIQGLFDPATKHAYMVADALFEDTAGGVLMHEVGIHMAASGGKLAPLVNRAAFMVKNAKGAFFDDVRQKMAKAREKSAEEAAAYLVEAYENSRDSAPSAVKQWFKDFMAAVRAWLFRAGRGLVLRADQLTAADIAAVARANAKRFARGGVGGGSGQFLNRSFDGRVEATAENIQSIDDEAMFSRQRAQRAFSPAAKKQAIDAVQSQVSGIKAAWKNAPDVVVAFDMNDPVIPEAVRKKDQAQRSSDAGGAPEGFYYQGKVYLMASKLPTARDTTRVLFHEALGHHGLRGVFGESLHLLLRQIVTMRKQEIKAKIEDYKRRGVKHISPLVAAEEMLAEMAENAPDVGFARHAIAAIKQWLKDNIPGFDGMKFTDDDIVSLFIVPARRFVEGGNGPNGGGGVDSGIRFSRTGGNGQPPTGAVPNYFDVKDAGGRAKEGMADRLADWRGLSMQALGRRQIVDLWGKLLPQLGRYDDLVQKMDAEKNATAAGADELATAWAELDGKGFLGLGKAKNAGMEAKLAELMHDATLGGVDADPSVPLPNDATVAQKMAKGAFTKRFDALTPDAQAVYRKVRDIYADQNKAIRKALTERIERAAELSPDSKRTMIAQMDADMMWEKRGVYFPLSRFGKYVVVVKDASGKTMSVSRAETLPESKKLRAELQSRYPSDQGFHVSKVYLDHEFNAARDAVGKGFMGDLVQTLRNEGMDEGVIDSVGQLYLKSLPDLSWAKHGIHRKGTPGFSQDARRAFAQNMIHGASHLAKLRYADRLQMELTDMQTHIKANQDDDGFDNVKAVQVYDEMVKRHDLLMSPKTHPLSTALTSAGFLFYLGLSPASAAVNLSQTALLAYPIMGAKWGYDKAGAALLKASAEVAKAKNDYRSVLQGDELKALTQAIDDGTIDVTMVHDLAGIAGGEDQRVTWAMRPVMRAASFMFHHAEKFNRQATFIAAYRLARENPLTTHDQAFAEARKATYDGHFDYSAANRPRVMQGNWAKVLLLFKQYGQNMIYTLARQTYLSIKGDTPEQKREARKAISGILALHAFAAGVLGLPVVGTLLALASAMGGDDDEPWDAKVAIQNALAESLGQKPAEVLAHGLSRLTPWDMSGRVALNSLILPDVQEGLEGQRLAESAMTAALGPVAGIGVGFARGVQKMSQGDYARGFEDMLPVSIRNPLKAMRYATEGNVDKTGVVINDEVSAAGVAGQALGFAPSETRLAAEGKQAIYQADKRLSERRAQLMRLYSMAKMADDDEGVTEAREAIARFNAKNPDRKITVIQLAQSVKSRQKRIAEAQQGVYLPENRRGALDAGRFAVTAE